MDYFSHPSALIDEGATIGTRTRFGIGHMFPLELKLVQVVVLAKMFL